MTKFIKGMDLSTLLELDRCGAKYYDHGKERDILDIMKDYDVDTIRLRLWNDPKSELGEPYGAGNNDLAETIAIGKKVTDAGFGVLLNFHYSDFWSERIEQRLHDPDFNCYVLDREFPDADVTSYIKLILQCGVTLYGPPPKKIFSEISDEDFWQGISADVENYDFHSYKPCYLASNVLILGRILSFKKERRILSKYEAGLWMIENVPQSLKYLPERAMKIWFEGEALDLPEDDLEKLPKYLIAEIQK